MDANALQSLIRTIVVHRVGEGAQDIMVEIPPKRYGQKVLQSYVQEKASRPGLSRCFVLGKRSLKFAYVQHLVKGMQIVLKALKGQVLTHELEGKSCRVPF
jgi:hypothetical protein